jgi:LysR family glycine cleavage system transcriptional activator
MATRKVIEDGFTDILTVHCAPSFAPAWLMPRLPHFLAAHPDTDVRLHATPEPCDFVRGNVDLEIRYGEGDWPGLQVHRLMAEMVTPMCSPGLLARLPQPLLPIHLATVCLIHSERCTVQWPAWFNANGVDGVNVARGLRFDRGYLSIQAAVAGLGFALESTVFAGRELAAGVLVMPLLGRSISPEAPSHYLVYPQATRTIPKIQKFRDWILAEANGSA